MREKTEKGEVKEGREEETKQQRKRKRSRALQLVSFPLCKHEKEETKRKSK